MKGLAALLLLGASALYGQSNSGELRLVVTDASGRGVKTTVHIASEANQYRTVLQTDSEGDLDVQRLPYGIYRLEVEQPGFAAASEVLAIRSSLPTSYIIHLKVPTVTQSVTVKAASTLIDPDQSGSINQIGAETIRHRLGSIPGRSLQDLVNSQPGWLYEIGRAHV